MTLKRRTSRRSMHDTIVFTVVTAGIIITAVIGILMPEVVIGSLVTDTLGAMILLAGATFLGWYYSVDSSGRRRRRGGPFGSKWTSELGYLASVLGLGLIFFIYFIVAHDFVSSQITLWIIQTGKESGIALLIVSGFSSLILIYKILRTLGGA